jgi:hypothetical protein
MKKQISRQLRKAKKTKIKTKNGKQTNKSNKSRKSLTRKNLLRGGYPGNTEVNGYSTIIHTAPQHRKGISGWGLRKMFQAQSNINQHRAKAAANMAAKQAANMAAKQATNMAAKQAAQVPSKIPL